MYSIIIGETNYYNLTFTHQTKGVRNKLLPKITTHTNRQSHWSGCSWHIPPIVLFKSFWFKICVRSPQFSHSCGIPCYRTPINHLDLTELTVRTLWQIGKCTCFAFFPYVSWKMSFSLEKRQHLSITLLGVKLCILIST